MKKLLIGLLALGSFSTFAAESLKSIPQGAIRQGLLTSATYEFNKIEYRERDGFKPRKDKKVLVTLSGIEQSRNSAYSNNVGQSGSENLGGPATDIKTKLNIRLYCGSGIKTQIKKLCLLLNKIQKKNTQFIFLKIP